MSRAQVRLADLLAGGDELHLRHAVHGINVEHPFHPVLIALMNAVYTDVPGIPLGYGARR